MPATTGPTEAGRQVVTPTRPTASDRSGSTASSNRQRTKQQGDLYSTDHDIDDGDEGDYEGDDADEDEDELQPGAEGYGGQDMLNETTIKSGYLWKRGEKRKNWKKRWFALRSSKLCYYKNEKEYQLLRFIDMADVHTVAAIALKKNENSFGIVTSKRQYYVRASNPKEMQSWIEALKEVQQQAKQSSTMTQDMSAMEVAASSGGENALPSAQRPRQAPASPSMVPLDRQQMVKGDVNAAPINIVIPGKGLYTSPAQPRQNSTGTSITSPLTVTSESDAGTATGAEQFGLSYASSQGHSMASSPTRQTIFHPHTDHSSGGRASPHSHSGGDDVSDQARRSRIQKGSAQGMHEAYTGHSGGEGSSSARTGWTASKGQSQAISTHAQHQQQGQGGPVLSSSDEDEGDDWDEDEIADQAMPLPGSSAVTSTLPSQSVQSNASGTAPTTSNSGKEKVESHFLKDPNKVILQGYLMKQSSRTKQWRKRYFTLTSSVLSYSRSHMNGKAHRQIPLTSILDAIEYTSKKSQNNVQSPPPSSPGLPNMQSPSSNLAAGVSHGGAAVHEIATGGNAAQKEAATAKGSETGADHALLDRKNSLLGAATPNAPRKKKENCFKIITPKRTYVVGAPTEEEELRWLCALQALLARWRDVKEAENADQGATRPASNAATMATPIRLNRRGSTADDVNAQD